MAILVEDGSKLKVSNLGEFSNVVYTSANTDHEKQHLWKDTFVVKF